MEKDRPEIPNMQLNAGVGLYMVIYGTLHTQPHLLPTPHAPICSLIVYKNPALEPLLDP